MEELEAIKRDLEALRASKLAMRDIEAKRHRFVLNSPLSESKVAKFEQVHRIRLPQDYRGFLMHVGNGGAGPTDGVFKLGEIDDGFGRIRWKENKGFVGLLREPFPHVKPWNDRKGLPKYNRSKIRDVAYNEEFEAQLMRWDRYYWSPRHVDGALPICHLGSGYRVWLVVSGREAGHLWADYRTDQEGIKPFKIGSATRVTFVAWYRRWLDEALQRAKIRRPKDAPRKHRAGK